MDSFAARNNPDISGTPEDLDSSGSRRNLDPEKLASLNWEPHPPRELNVKERGYLKSLAHHLIPVVRIGQEGVTSAVIGEIRKQLLAHELVKVKWSSLSKEEGKKKEQARELACKAGAHYVDLIGHIVMLYREPEPRYLRPGRHKKIILPD